MIDLSKTIEAKSDQLNADDLLGGPRVLKITGIKAGSAEQPVSISYEGDNGKPWKPSKGMRRVLVAAWGPDGSEYIGRYVEVHCDLTVKWAVVAMGGEIVRMAINEMELANKELAKAAKAEVENIMSKAV